MLSIKETAPNIGSKAILVWNPDLCIRNKKGSIMKTINSTRKPPIIQRGKRIDPILAPLLLVYILSIFAL